MPKRLRYKIGLATHPDKWLIAELLKEIDGNAAVNKIFFVREMHGMTIDEFRNTTDEVTVTLDEVELAKHEYDPTLDELD